MIKGEIRNLTSLSDPEHLAAYIDCYVRNALRGGSAELLLHIQSCIQAFAASMN